jgi:hypothetical protein
VTTLRADGAEKPRAEKAALQWKDADTLALEVPLYGTETALATVDIPGHGPVALPPVCLPYSPEYKPAASGSGIAALERLARATGGKERVDLAGIWGELPKQPRLVEMGPWLLIVAVVLLLLEVLERRTALLAGWGHRLGRQGKRPFKRGGQTEQQRNAADMQEGAIPEEEKVIVPTVEPPRQAGLLEALRQARRRTRGGTGKQPPR